ncbi:PAS sensor signal transduction histidine kinase [Pseudogulbenkiania sp. NH8B]|uniref:PAS domain S-box protein n=1 Tax=Pseudogulbenkiania sp. (strain NH8B) TaxID=748280 RepID=UPI0002279CCA|nr:PAS domain S-box protein [Pseudogulbenkiania sp. NH8B]BAK75973.1 PAS sensor signal transduction histidine kinase [Pseudogulbenkiania sp. NH8B]
MLRYHSTAQRQRPSWYRLFPNASIVLFFLTMAVMLWALDSREAEQLRTALARDALWAEQTLQLHLEDNLNQLTELAREAGRDDLDESGFQLQAAQFIGNTPELLAVVRADTGMILRWIAPYEDGPLTLGDGLSGPSADAFVKARIESRPVYSRPYQSADGQWRIELHVPVLRNGQFVGTMIAVFNTGTLIRRLPPSWFAEKYQLELIDAEGRDIGHNAQQRLSGTLSEKLDLPGTGLAIIARPVKTATSPSRVLQLGLIVGLTLLTLMSLLSLNRHIRRRVSAEEERDRVYRLSQDLLGIISPEGTLLEVNPAFETVLGYTQAQLIGTSFLSYLHPSERDMLKEGFFDMLGADQSHRYVETRVLTREGATHWIVWALSPLPESGVIYVSGRDITAKKEAQEALWQESTFRKAMEDSLVVGLRAIDLEGRITYVNPAFCDITGYREQELLGQLPPYPYWRSGEAAELHQRHMAAALTGNAPQDGLETQIRRKDGKEIHVNLLISPLIDHDGQHTGWMTAMTDITERQEAKQRLEASHERFVTVIEGLDAAVAVVDPASHELLFCNQHYRQWFDPDNVLGQEESASCCDLRLAFLMRDAERSELDLQLQLANPPRWLSARRRQVRWVDGRPTLMVILTDITQQHEAEQRYEQQMEKLQATSRLVTMGEMASTLAHELNQPLSAIANYQAGCIERLRQGRASAESLLPVMEKITAQAERAGKIVRRVREFVKQSEPDRKPCQLTDIVEATLAIADIEARRYAATIDLQLPPRLPEVCVDPILIEQVLLNLIKNGIEAMQDTEPARRQLIVSADVLNPRRVEVAIADRGHGVPADLKERLFDAFFTTKKEGMGMGLNICRTIIEFHQGQLWVEDNPDGGSIFRLTLPVTEA